MQKCQNVGEKMICLVTGGLGFIGSNLVDVLVRQGHEVHVWDDLSSESSSEDYKNPQAAYEIADIRSSHWNFFEHPKYDVIFHLAAHARIQPSFEIPLDYLSNDIMGTAHVCELARKLGSKVVYAGSSTAFGGPMLNPYAFAKFTGEQVCEMYHKVFGLKVATARFFNVYGPRQPKTGTWATVIGVFENLWLEGSPMTVTGDGEQRRDFTHVDDIVAGLVALSKIDGKGEIYSLGTGMNYTLNMVAIMFSDDIVHIAPRPGEVHTTCADPTAINAATGWKASVALHDYVQNWKRLQSGL
jgi:UDP-glucose 4-epimerase